MVALPTILFVPMLMPSTILRQLRGGTEDDIQIALANEELPTSGTVERNTGKSARSSFAFRLASPVQNGQAGERLVKMHPLALNRRREEAPRVRV